MPPDEEESLDQWTDDMDAAGRKPSPEISAWRLK